MFWRRKNDGFEWHKYVRTTIKLRRDDRRRKVRAAKDAAVQGLENAGRAGVHAGRVGMASVAEGFVAGLVMVAATLRAGAMGLSHWVARLAASCLSGVRAAWRGLGRTAFNAWTTTQRHIPILARVPQRAAAAAGIAVAGVFSLAMGVLAARHLPATGLDPLAFIPGFSPVVIEGRAVATGAGALRIDGKLVRLAGIDVPQPEQRCGGAGRSGVRCTAAAQSALRDAVRNKSVRCQARGPETNGRVNAVCTVYGRDLAADLVAKGLVFAEEGHFSQYATLEREAREGKLGVWRTRTVERPQAYRDRRWEVAKRKAPEGCPIKGQVVGGDRVYVLPWSSQYERVRVQHKSGGRWFCSEQEARAAGWRSNERS